MDLWWQPPVGDEDLLFGLQKIYELKVWRKNGVFEISNFKEEKQTYNLCHNGF